MVGDEWICGMRKWLEGVVYSRANPGKGRGEGGMLWMGGVGEG